MLSKTVMSCIGSCPSVSIYSSPSIKSKSLSNLFHKLFLVSGLHPHSRSLFIMRAAACTSELHRVPTHCHCRYAFFIFTDHQEIQSIFFAKYNTIEQVLSIVSFHYILLPQLWKRAPTPPTQQEPTTFVWCSWSPQSPSLFTSLSTFITSLMLLLCYRHSDLS